MFSFIIHELSPGIIILPRITPIKALTSLSADFYAHLIKLLSSSCSGKFARIVKYFLFSLFFVAVDRKAANCNLPAADSTFFFCPWMFTHAASEPPDSWEHEQENKRFIPLRVRQGRPPLTYYHISAVKNTPARSKLFLSFRYNFCTNLF